jgi:hypothetical protein
MAMVKVGEFSLFWFAWHLIPGASALRAGGRAQIVINGFVVAVVAIVLTRWMQTIRSWRLRVVVWALLLVCVLEQINVVSNHNLSRAEEMAALKIVPPPLAACKSFYVSPHTLERGPTIQQTNAMLIAQVVNLPTLNGYSGWSPRGWRLYETKLPSYRGNAWLWAASHGIDDGLCEYDVARRYWLPAREDLSLQTIGAVLRPGTSINFGSVGDGDIYEVGGWSRPEPFGTWTDGPAAALAGRVTHWPAVDMILRVTARPFLVRELHTLLRVDVEINGTVVDRWTYRYDQDNGFVTRSTRVPGSLLAGLSVLKVKFRIDQPANPKMVGVHPTDDRSLGLFFSRVTFNAASSNGDSAR